MLKYFWLPTFPCDVRIWCWWLFSLTPQTLFRTHIDWEKKQDAETRVWLGLAGIVALKRWFSSSICIIFRWALFCEARILRLVRVVRAIRPLYMLAIGSIHPRMFGKVSIRVSRRNSPGMSEIIQHTKWIYCGDTWTSLLGISTLILQLHYVILLSQEVMRHTSYHIIWGLSKTVASRQMFMCKSQISPKYRNFILIEIHIHLSPVKLVRFANERYLRSLQNHGDKSLPIFWINQNSSGTERFLAEVWYVPCRACFGCWPGFLSEMVMGTQLDWF